jgi:hypothetical protein
MDKLMKDNKVIIMSKIKVGLLKLMKKNYKIYNLALDNIMKFLSLIINNNKIIHFLKSISRK